MHLKRWITAIVLLPILIGILLKGSSLLFSLLVCVITLISMKEYLLIVTAGFFDERSFYLEGLSYVVSIGIIAAAYLNSMPMLLFLVVLNVLAAAAVVVAKYSPDSTVLTSVAFQVQGIVYVPVFLSFLVWLRNSENGGLWVVWLWLIIAASDTGAYYTGTYFGKRPLSPKVSPKKTVEGSLGGISAAMIVGLGFSQLLLPGTGVLNVLVFAVVAAAVGQLGDLFESALKRSGNIKDSGKILPGHGGVLDRIDGLIFALPVAFIFKAYLL